MSQTIKVMSFNLRVNVAVDGANAFPNRTERIRNVILKESPDLIGFQEVTADMKDTMRSLLPEYTIVGCGRGVGFDGESMALAMKNKKIELLSLEQFWLSPTPSLPGSRYAEDQSSCPRMALSARIAVTGSSKPIRICNTHLDHVGEKARYQGMMQILQHLSTCPETIILTGDMNAIPTSPEIGLVTSVLSYRGMRDCSASVGPTFHGFGRVKDPIKIDYIFSDAVCNYAYTLPEPDTQAYYSDHYAVVCELETE